MLVAVTVESEVSLISTTVYEVVELESSVEVVSSVEAVSSVEDVSSVDDVSDDVVFGHNGVINSVDDDIKLSDTRMFNKQVLKPLNKKDDKFMFNPVFRFLIENSIGSSKLAFLKSDGKFSIIGESLGNHWRIIDRFC